jgi:hypothetical protein
MAAGQWMRVLDAVGGLVELSGRFRRRSADGATLPDAAGRAGGPLEARLAGVLVAALKEAFDRDRVRMELERSQVETEWHRAEYALRAELRRQAADRALAHLRLIAVIAVGAWALSAALGVWLPGMRAAAPRALLGAGWALIFGALGCAFAGWRSILMWSADADAEPVSGPDSSTARGGREPLSVASAPWLLLAALALIGASLLFAL